MTPLFKVGQKVRIKKREGKDDDYKYSFVDDMANMAGQIVTVTEVMPAFSHESRKYADDCAKYYIDIGSWSWASSMLEPIEEGITFNRKKNHYKLNFKL